MRSLPRNVVQPPAHVPLAQWQCIAAKKQPARDMLERVDELLATAFAGPHTVRDALRGVATPAILKKQAAMNNWQPTAHPRTLSPKAWVDLASFLMSIGKI